MDTKLNVGISCFFLLAVAACSDDEAPADGTPARAQNITWKTDVIASFDPAAGELPEGVAVKGGLAYAGFAPTGAIAKVDLHSGNVEPFAQLPPPVPNAGFMTGLAFGPDGLLYAALVSFDPSVQPGIYRVSTAGGDAEMFAKVDNMVFPNGLVFDSAGDLFVTDSAAGTIFKIDPTRTVAPWVTSELLTGDQSLCGGSGNAFPIGANGLVEHDGAFYATNTDKGLLIRIAINADGTAGNPETVAGPDCAGLAGADGLTIDPQGDFMIAVNRQNKIVRVTSAGEVEIALAGAALDFPASLTVNGSTIIATNFALANASSGKPAKPGLFSITASQ